MSHLGADDRIRELEEQRDHLLASVAGWKARAGAPATLAPQPKVVAGGVTGAAVVLLVWVASLFGLDVPDYVALAVVAVIGSGAAYLKR